MGIRYCFWIFVPIIVFIVSLGISEGGNVSRVRRNAFQMCSLVGRYTGRSCLDYNPYGCFCGYGQQGSTPVDDADRCCKEHDDCYGEVQNHCFFWSGLFVGYNNVCDTNGCTCIDEEKCARKVCACDLKLAICLGKSSYTSNHKHYNRYQCV